VPARSRPGRPEAQPLLNHKRQSYGSCAYTALDGLSTLTCSYLTRTDLPSQQTVTQTAPTSMEARSHRTGPDQRIYWWQVQVRTWVG